MFIGPGTTIGAGATVASAATYYQPGLVLHLDAGNDISYSGGSDWFDMVSGNSFVLYENPTHSIQNGGYFTFNSSLGQYARGPSLASALSTWTVEAWVYYTGNHTGNSPCFVTEIYDGTPINFTLGSTNDNTPNIQAGFYNSSTWAATPEGYSLIPNNWYQLTGTFDGTNIKLYLNGAQWSTNTTGLSAARGGEGIRLMRRWDAAEYMDGRMAIVRIYDRDIGSAGIAANWEANRTRFGL